MSYTCPVDSKFKYQRNASIKWNKIAINGGIHNIIKQ